MELNIGDKVSFLNEKRDGKIVKILDNETVVVEIEDGFEIPVLKKELVRRFTAGGEKAKSVMPEKVSVIQQEEEPVDDVPDEFQIEIHDRNLLGDGHFLAFIEGRNFRIDEEYVIYLINNTDKKQLYVISQKVGGSYFDTFVGRAAERTMVHIDFIEKYEKVEWENLYYRAISYKLDSLSDRKIIESEIIRNEGILHGLVRQKLAGGKISGFVIVLKECREPEVWEEKIWEQAKTEKRPGLKIVGHIKDFSHSKPEYLGKHAVAQGIAEVDLHIEELAENVEGMTNHDMFVRQMEYFRNCLEEAVLKQFQRVIFIHGKGNGKLRDAIRTETSEKYPQAEIMDASMAKYGIGATVLRFPRNMK